MDIKKPGHLDRQGHRVTGTRRARRNRGAGRDFVHVAVDDTTRLANIEVLEHERKQTMAGSLARAPCAGSGPGVSAPKG